MKNLIMPIYKYLVFQKLLSLYINFNKMLFITNKNVNDIKKVP